MRIHDFFQTLSHLSLSYDDLILLPGYVSFGVGDVSLSSQLTREIQLSLPIVSSPMDTVTESDMAIAIALMGGLGLIHYNLSVEEQLAEIKRVKRFKNGFVVEPATLPPTARIRDVVKIRQEMGYSIVPITDDGQSHGKLLGMVTKNDYSAFSEEYLDKAVSERMTPLDRLGVVTLEEITVDGEPNFLKANERLLDSYGPALSVVDQRGRLMYLITRSDLQKHSDFPHASVDGKSKSLLVGAAIETWPQKAYERLEAVQEFADVVVFDTSQGYSAFEIELIEYTKKKYPHLQVIGGNVVTERACEALIAAGADGIRVGMGIGSICTTQEVGGIGRGQASAVFRCSRVCQQAGVPLIADGGISKSSDMVKALSLGASTVMLGSLLACTKEAPGKCEIKNGVKLKSYQGMGSLKAMRKGSAVRYGLQSESVQVPEGVSGQVTYKGKVAEWVPHLRQGICQGLSKLGYPTLAALHRGWMENEIELEQRSDGAKREGGVHSLYGQGE